MKTPTTAQLDREPPHSEEAERAILGSILLAPELVLDECAEAGLADNWFYDGRHGIIYHNLKALHAAGIGVDTLTLSQRLKDTGDLDRVGDMSYLASLPDAVPNSAHAAYYLDILREKWLMRHCLTTFVTGTMNIYENEGTVDSLLADVAKKISDVMDTSVPRTELVVKHYLPALIDKLEGYHRGRAQMHGLATGLEYPDKILCGLGGSNGNMIVLAARPGTGKTSLALQIALNVALDHPWFEVELDAAGCEVMVDDKPKIKASGVGMPVGVFSVEMAAASLVERMLFQRAEADMQRFRTGFAVAEEFLELVKAEKEFHKMQIHIDDSPKVSIEELVSKARRMHRQLGIKLFIVDYVQLLYSTKNYKNDRVQEVAYISGCLRALGKLLNVPIIVIAQMNRDYEKDPLRAPRMSDLKDCGALEQDADVIGFLYKPKLGEKAAAEFDRILLDKFSGEGKKLKVDWSLAPARINLLIAKNRYGPADKKAELLFFGSSTSFADYGRWKKDHGYANSAAGEKKTAAEREGKPPDERYSDDD